MPRVLLATAALAAAVAVLVGLALPPGRLAPASGTGDDAVPGVLHVHTNRSDGRSSPEEIAAIAARAGLKFVVFTDHGDATREPDPPTYRSGVLCIDAVEISTNEGHLVALGLSAAPYPLAGEARDVIEDVHRLNGIGIAAHPDSPKTDLQWRDWEVPLDGVELINLDTTWRLHALEQGWRPKLRLLTALATYVWRPAETIAGLLTDSPALVTQWNALAARRPVPLFAGLDAHARLELRDAAPGDNRFTLALPGYEAVFRTLTMRVRPQQRLSGDATIDASLVLQALGSGHAYASVDGLLAPSAFEFTASAAGGTAMEGDEIGAAGPLTLAVRSNAPATFTTTVWRNGEPLTSRSTTPELALTAPDGPAVYRVEIRATDHPGSPVWVVSNPIYVRAPASDIRAIQTARAPTARQSPEESPRVLFSSTLSADWRTEVAPASRVALDVTTAVGSRELRVRYGLPGGDGFGQYAAVVVDTSGGIAPHDRLVFTARGERPMRLSIQLRVPLTGEEGERWQRSVYLDPTESTHAIPFDDFRPVGVTRTARAPLADVHAVLFTVDRTNTKPGSSGRFWLKDVALR